ncbi:hypothetical protein B9479_008343, partial [Cryptococcus floricola]
MPPQPNNPADGNLKRKATDDAPARKRTKPPPLPDIREPGFDVGLIMEGLETAKAVFMADFQKGPPDDLHEQERAMDDRLALDYDGRNDEIIDYAEFFKQAIKSACKAREKREKDALKAQKKRERGEGDWADVADLAEQAPHDHAVKFFQAQREGSAKLSTAKKSAVLAYLYRRQKQDFSFCIKHKIKHSLLMHSAMGFSGLTRKSNSWNLFQKSEAGKSSKKSFMAESTSNAPSNPTSTSSQTDPGANDAAATGTTTQSSSHTNEAATDATNERSQKQREATSRLIHGASASKLAYAAQKALGLERVNLPDFSQEEAKRRLD